MPSQRLLLTTLLTVSTVLVAACSGQSDGGAAPATTTAKATNQLPADAVVALNPYDRGVSRLEGKNLGATLAPASAYQQAVAAGDFGTATQRFVGSFPELFGDAQFSVRSSSTDALGLTTVRLDQRHADLAVFGGELLAHFSGTALVRVVGDYAGVIDLASTTAGNSERAAFEVAAAAVDGLADCASCVARLGIYRTTSSNVQNPLRLVWEVDAGVSPINAWRLRIDTETLEILDKQPLAMNAAP